jgi:TIR domain
MERDAFICHKSTDKPTVVRPLVELLESRRITCWIDEAEIVWGDSLTGKVNEGLRSSRYVVVVLSTSFIQQSWPEKELYAALDLGAASGKSKVLPLLVGSNSDHQRILEHYH